MLVLLKSKLHVVKQYDANKVQILQSFNCADGQQQNLLFQQNYCVWTFVSFFSFIRAHTAAATTDDIGSI